MRRREQWRRLHLQLRRVLISCEVHEAVLMSSQDMSPSDVSTASAMIGITAAPTHTMQQRAGQTSRTRMTALPRRRPASRPRRSTSASIQVKSEVDKMKLDPKSPRGAELRRRRNSFKHAGTLRKKGLAREPNTRPYGHPPANSRQSNVGRTRWSDTLRSPENAVVLR